MGIVYQRTADTIGKTKIKKPIPKVSALCGSTTDSTATAVIPGLVSGA